MGRVLVVEHLCSIQDVRRIVKHLNLKRNQPFGFEVEVDDLGLKVNDLWKLCERVPQFFQTPQFTSGGRWWKARNPYRDYPAGTEMFHVRVYKPT